MQVRYRIALLVAIVVTAFSGAAVAPSAAVVSPTAATKSCSSGYVHAVLSWGHKCLRAGQFCKVGNREYLRYGFYCPRGGHLRRRR